MNNVNQILKIGDIIQDDVYTAGKVLLIKKGTVITLPLLNGLERFDCDFNSIDIIVEREGVISQVAGVTAPQPDNEPAAQQDESIVFSDKLKHDAVEAAKMLFAADANLREVSDTAVSISNDIASNIILAGNDARLCIQDLRVTDEYTYQHSVDVGVLAAQLAKSLGMPPKWISEAAQAGVLHDIGKRRVPPEILNKPGKLTDEEFRIMKLHPVFAEEDLHLIKGVSQAAKAGAYEHHEKLDGTGYPRGLKGSGISRIAQILAIADIYDALTSKRVYKPGMSSARAVRIMMGMLDGLNREYFVTFLKSLILYPTGSRVLGTDGRSYVVYKQNPQSPMQPFLLDETSGNIIDVSQGGADHVSVFGEDCEEMRLKWLEGQNK